MRMRPLGHSGPRVATIGLGCMGASPSSGVHHAAVSMATYERAFAIGVYFFASADACAPYPNAERVGRLLWGRRDRKADALSPPGRGS